MSPTSRRQPPAFPFLAVAFAAAGAGAACRGESPTAAPEVTGPARLQVINAARTPVDILVDGTVRVRALADASVSPPLDVAEGARRLEMRPVGAATGAVLTQVTARASAMALVAAQVGAGGALAATVLTDTAAIPAPGTSKLRVLHLAPNAPPTRIWVLFPSDAAKAADPAAYGNGGPWPYGGATPFYQDTPGNWDVVITPAAFAGGSPPPSPTDSAHTNGAAAGGSRDPHAYALARLVMPVAGDQARTVVMLDAPGGGVRVATTGAP